MDPREEGLSSQATADTPPHTPAPVLPASGQPPTPGEIDDELARLSDLPLAGHVEVFAEIHRRLAASLAVTGQAGTGDDAAPGRADRRPEQVATQQHRPGGPHQRPGRQIPQPNRPFQDRTR